MVSHITLNQTPPLLVHRLKGLMYRRDKELRLAGLRGMQGQRLYPGVPQVLNAQRQERLTHGGDKVLP